MKKLYAAIAILAITFGNIGLSSARQSHQGKAPTESVAGVFDYYLLTLSWSPTFCLTHKDDTQCSGKGYGFVLTASGRNTPRVAGRSRARRWWRCRRPSRSKG